MLPFQTNRETRLKRTAINTKLLKIFLIQVLLISAVTVLGVFAAALITEEVLVKQALEREADYFWERYRNQPEIHAPDTLNLQGYLAHQNQLQGLPRELHNLPLGKSRIDFHGKDPIVHVSQNGEHRLYLIFNEQQVSQLSFFFGIAPLALVLLVLYALAYYTYRQANRALSPIRKLANSMRHYDVNQADTPLDVDALSWDADEETHVLVDAMNTFIHRVQELINRERTFSRYASHELRTPLAVIKGSIDNLERQSLPEGTQRHLARMKSTVQDMEQMMNALLELSRDATNLTTADTLQLNDLIELLAEQHRQHHPDSPVALTVEHRALLQVRGSTKLISILINNLLNNAQTYTASGRIVVTVDKEGFSVADTGIGIPATEQDKVFSPFYRVNQQSEKGFGLGLAIVEKICRELGWHIQLHSEEDAGTTFTVTVAAPV
ncbi:sensor histidine kinase [Ketobacter sp.]|uniref:sensor histidine kinase n=1 Tax=Ketobacter sp. TaxID=2083498 RepID=UPI000F0EB00A|nr:HAMP domain-containing sensor histidine kinase [Ketobacter sp.]RLT94740.1 MAG: sensor histidine kinase [Ketobacter sp.]